MTQQTNTGEKHTGNPGNFAEDREKAARAGRTGGQHSQGNFANDRERAAEAGRKGGEASHGSGSHGSGSHGSGSHDETHAKSSSEGERRSGNFADDREKASEAGRKGGQASHRS